MSVQEGYCCICKKKTPDEKINAFGECSSSKCDGRFMNDLRKGDGPMFRSPKKKILKKFKKAKKKTGEAWRGYNNVRKENLAKPLYGNDDGATVEEEQELAEKI